MTEEEEKKQEAGEEKDFENEAKKIFLSSKAIAGAVIIAVAFFSIGFVSNTGSLTGQLTGNVLSGEAAAARALEYINAIPGVSGNLTGVNDTGTVYEIDVNIKTSQGTNPMTFYVSKDGEYLFLQSVNIDQAIAQIKQQTQQQNQQKTTAPSVPKSDKPEVELFIMSYCPYGLQMQKALLPVWELLGDKADISVKWVSYIMHGKKELDENTVQYCIQKEQPEKYLDYASCFTESGEKESCLEEAGIDTDMLDSCISETDEEFNITGLYDDRSTWQGGRFPQYNVYADLNSKYGVRGSPTMVINGKTVSITRSPEAVKQAVCNAFNTPPEECNENLSAAQMSPGFGGGTASGSGGSCG